MPADNTVTDCAYASVLRNVVTAPDNWERLNRARFSDKEYSMLSETQSLMYLKKETAEINVISENMSCSIRAKLKNIQTLPKILRLILKAVLPG